MAGCSAGAMISIQKTRRRNLKTLRRKSRPLTLSLSPAGRGEGEGDSLHLAIYATLDEIEKKEIDKIHLVDAHAHLDELTDLTEILQEAKTTGVRGIIAVGMDVESNRKVLQIAEENPGYVYPALGYHPWRIKEEEVEA